MWKRTIESRVFDCAGTVVCVLVAAAFLSVAAAASAPAREKGAAKNGPEKMIVKVMSINIRHNSDYWEERFPLIADEIVRLEPDIIGLQEVMIGIGQSDTLLGLIKERGGKDKGLSYTVFEKLKSGFEAMNGEGIAIFSRFPIVKETSRNLEHGRVVLLARVKAGEGLYFDVYNTHLHHRGGDDVRAPQAAKIVEMARKLDSGLITFLTGDMNAIDDSETIALFRDAGFVDSYPDYHGEEFTRENGNTSPVLMIKGSFSQNFTKRIDYVFHRAPLEGPGIRTIDSVVCFNEPNGDALYPSDHLGVMTAYEIEY